MFIEYVFLLQVSKSRVECVTSDTIVLLRRYVAVRRSRFISISVGLKGRQVVSKSPKGLDSGCGGDRIFPLCLLHITGNPDGAAWPASQTRTQHESD